MLKNTGSHALHLVMEALIGLVGLVAIAGCVLAWRLGQGPIDITALAQRELYRLPAAGAHLTVGHAELAWEGFADPGKPLDIRWRDITIDGVDGVRLARLATGRVTLSVGRLLTGEIVPRDVELDHASLALERGADGAVRLSLADSGGGGPGPGGAALVRDLARPPGETSVLPFLSQMRRIRVRDASVTLRDAVMGLTWQAKAPAIDLKRERQGGVSGQGTLDLQLGAAHATLTLRSELTGAGTTIEASTTPVVPAALAGVAAPFAALRAVNAPVSFALHASLDPALALRTATLSVQAGAGTLLVGKGQIALASAAAEVQADPASVHLTSFRLAQTPASGTRLPPPVLTATAEARRTAAGWHATFDAALDRVGFADLAFYWPLGTGGGARPWVTENITAGSAENGHVTGALDMAADYSGLALTSLAGGIAASDITLHWLRPVPPMEHAAARLVIDGPDALHIDVPKAMQGKLLLSAGRVGIVGLSQKDQFGDITANIDGGLAPLLALLNHPRLQLLSRRPITMTDPAGTASVKLHVKLPLEAGVSIEALGIGATAKLAEVHLGGIAAGRDLDHGALNLAVDTNALKITGTGEVGAVPADLAVDMDFRGGPPGQVLEHYVAHGSASAAQMAAAGVPWLTGGTAAIDVDYAARRDGSGALALSADMRAASVATPFGWQKAAGAAATTDARIRLQGSRIAGIEQFRAEGPGLKVASHAVLEEGQPRKLVLDQVRLGRTDASGSVTLPMGERGTLRVALRGAVLDLSDYLKQRGDKKQATEPEEDDDKPGEPWDVSLSFGQLILAKDEMLAPASLSAASDGLRITHAELSAGARGEARARITPQAGGRALSVQSDNAGAALLAAGVADNIRGGKLRLDAVYNDLLPHSPLSGTATLETFRMIDAPAIGRLLKAMTLYGAVDLLNGPGLGFNKAVVPFRWQQGVLHLESARAFSASLGLTARGDIDLRHHVANLDGTIVPAYFFNQLLGDIPLVGRLFSPEKGGGVFAARYTVRGKLADPSIGVNPLSALTPGFLRGVFGLL